MAIGKKLKPIIKRYNTKNFFLNRSSIGIGDSPFKLAGWNNYLVSPSSVRCSSVFSSPFTISSTFFCDSSND